MRTNLNRTLAASAISAALLTGGAGVAHADSFEPSDPGGVEDTTSTSLEDLLNVSLVIDAGDSGIASDNLNGNLSGNHVDGSQTDNSESHEDNDTHVEDNDSSQSEDNDSSHVEDNDTSQSEDNDSTQSQNNDSTSDDDTTSDEDGSDSRQQDALGGLLTGLLG